jgi:hypothetical protein
MAEPGLTRGELQDVRRAFERASEQGWGIAIGLLAGLGLLIATVWLVVKGGPNPGPHLGLLSIYLPGYRVTWLGGLIGFAYAFAAGYIFGRLVAAIYNRLTPS